MMEERLNKLENEVKQMKTAMPISGSLIDTYCYVQSTTKQFQSGESFVCWGVFTPLNPDDKGIVEMTVYSENWSSSPDWQQFNPVFAYANTGYRLNSAGQYRIFTNGAFSSSDQAPWEARITVAVYGTVEGAISFEWS